MSQLSLPEEVVSMIGEPLISSARNERNIKLRPCFNLLRLLAIWQPNTAHWSIKLYNLLSYAYILSLFSMNLYNDIMKHIHLPFSTAFTHWTNSVVHMAIPLFPFFLLKWYYWGDYHDEYMESVVNNSDEKFVRLNKLSLQYTLIVALPSWLMFVAIMTFQTYPTVKAFDLIHCIITYAIVSIWLTVYCFSCHVNAIEYEEYQKVLLDKTAQFNFKDLLTTFEKYKERMEKSQNKFHFAISMMTVLHLGKMILDTIGYFTGE